MHVQSSCRAGLFRGFFSWAPSPAFILHNSPWTRIASPHSCPKYRERERERDQYHQQNHHHAKHTRQISKRRLHVLWRTSGALNARVPIVPRESVAMVYAPTNTHVRVFPFFAPFVRERYALLFLGCRPHPHQMNGQRVMQYIQYERTYCNVCTICLPPSIRLILCDALTPVHVDAIQTICWPLPPPPTYALLFQVNFLAKAILMLVYVLSKCFLMTPP